MGFLIFTLHFAKSESLDGFLLSDLESQLEAVNEVWTRRIKLFIICLTARYFFFYNNLVLS